MADLFENPNDVMQVEPADLGPAFQEVLTSCLAKSLADKFGKQWNDQQEGALQEHIASFVAAARERGLRTINLIITRKSSERVTQELDIERISRTRSLQ